MGRPRRHDERTSALLLRAAEAIVEAEGLSSLTLRRLADTTALSTRAVYSVFGSKDALVVALGSQAFAWLEERLRRRPLSDDPVSDLVDAGAEDFRGLVVEHPVLYQIGVQASWPAEMREVMATAANAAWQHVLARTERLAAAGLVGDRTPQQAAVEFHALCEGLASLEMRGLLPSWADEREAAAVWRRSLRALLVGLSPR